VRALRWGRSAYETDEALDLEEAGLAALGVPLVRHEGPDPPLHGVGVLVVTSKVEVRAEVVAAAPDLELVVTTTSGYEHLDLDTLQSAGVRAARCPIARRDAVVDTSLALALSLLRGLPGLHREAERGVWARGQLPSRAPGLVSGLDVGLVGLGVIGRAAAHAWRSLGAKVRWHDPALAGSLDLEELVGASRVVSLHCGHTDSSDGLVDATLCRAMRPGTLLVNTARGGCVVLDDVLEADHLGGLGLDVFDLEPPERLAEIAARPNTVLLPHAAGYHPGLGRAVADEVVATVEAFLDGRALPAALE